jgi:hypothetical protein
MSLQKIASTGSLGKNPANAQLNELTVGERRATPARTKLGKKIGNRLEETG